MFTEPNQKIQMNYRPTSHPKLLKSLAEMTDAEIIMLRRYRRSLRRLVQAKSYAAERPSSHNLKFVMNAAYAAGTWRAAAQTAGILI